MVKMGTTQAQRKLFYRIGDLPDASDADLHFDNVTKLADKINVTEDEVFDMWSRLKSRDLSLDDMLGENSRDSFTDTLRDESMNQELALAEIQEQMSLQDWASRALDTLSSRERYIIQKRILSDQPETLKDLGEHFGVTRERARQIERAALQKLKGNYLHSDLAAA
jgi:RNA polymerase sigma-32 factor